MNDDLISRSALMKAIKKLNEDNPFFAGIDEVVSLISGAPAVGTAPVVYGHLDGEAAFVTDAWYCSKCGCCIAHGNGGNTILPKYCHKCGAKMY